jgi:hypothetical protein
VLTSVFCWTITFVFCCTIAFVFCWTTTYVFYSTLPSMDMAYLIGILGSSILNFHIVNRMLIICESSIGAFSTFNFITALPLILYHVYHYFLHLLSTNRLCTQPCYFPLLYKPAAQKLKEILDSSMRSFVLTITPSRLPVELWCRSAAVSSRVFDLVFCKILFSNKYIIL